MANVEDLRAGADVYTSDGPQTRLADARHQLQDDARTIRDAEVKGFVIH